MRTNIIIDDTLLGEARKLTGIATKKDVVETALRLLVQMRRQEAVRAWRGKLSWSEDLTRMRTDKKR